MITFFYSFGLRNVKIYLISFEMSTHHSIVVTKRRSVTFGFTLNSRWITVNRYKLST
ncbi:hypothetical protein Hanom_Chr02g00143671 [Helianthus anomalus]